MDLEGTLISNGETLLGSIQLTEYLFEKNIPFRIITNAVSKSCKELYFALQQLGFEIPENYFINPIVTLKGYLLKNQIKSFWFIGPDEIKSQLGIRECYKGIPEYIILCDFEMIHCDYELLNNIFTYLHKGLKLMTMSQSKYYLSKSGPKLDTGAFCSMFENLTGSIAILFGKPSNRIYQEAISQMGIEANKIVTVGDDVLTDIKGAKEIGAYSILVKSGKYQKDDENIIEPDILVENLLEIIPHLKSINCGRE